MRLLILNFLILFSFCCFGQKQTVGKFVVAGDTLSYTKIDYGKNILGVTKITMYEDTEVNKVIPEKAAKCLKRIDNLYHTFYFFVGLPVTYTQAQRELAFAAFIKHIETVEGVEKVNYYINFDRDYSLYYQKNIVQNNEIKEINTYISPKNICKGL